MSNTTTKPTTYYTVQYRTESGWRRIKGYRRESSALDLLRGQTGQGTFRVITGDPHGDFSVLAMRCPAS